MEYKFLNEILKENFKLKKIKKNDYNYKYYVKQIKEIKEKNIKFYKFKEITNSIKDSLNFKQVKELLGNINEDVIYKSYGHGINHNIRVLLYATILSTLIGIDSKDLKIVVYSAMYHDIGRKNDFTDSSHGLKSAKKLDYLNLDLEEEELNILKTIITCHSIPQDDLEKTCKDNNVQDYERCKKLFSILKDSDALDRTRLEYPYIKLDFLKTKHAIRLVKMAYEIYYNFKLIMGDEVVMQLEKSKKYCRKKFRFNFKVKKIVDEQIENFFKIENSDFKLQEHKYKIGDIVTLNKDHYLHGIGRNKEAIDFVSQNGIVSKDIATGIPTKHAFKCVSGFWRVKEEISLKEYINNYSGMDVRYENESQLVPYKKLDKFVEDMKKIDHFKWEAESSMEIRFMPSLARDINQYGFILNISSHEAKNLIKNDVNADGYDNKIGVHFGMFDEKKDKDKIKKCSFANRASYVIFGLNRCFIEGVIVGRKVEKDEKELELLKQKFPDCYICNLDGIVIKK